MAGQVEGGSQWPLAWASEAVPTLRHSAALATEWLPRIFSRTYDARCAPAHDKRGALVGMAMTENQGGSDLRTNTTRAVPAGQEGGRRFFRISGRKWFMS